MLNTKWLQIMEPFCRSEKLEPFIFFRIAFTKSLSFKGFTGIKVVKYR